MSSADGGLPTGPVEGRASFTSIAGSPIACSMSRTTVEGSVPGRTLTLMVACADPGITLLRKPAFSITGAMVLRIIAWISGSDNGAGDVLASVVRNCRVIGIS